MAGWVERERGEVKCYHEELLVVVDHQFENVFALFDLFGVQGDGGGLFRRFVVVVVQENGRGEDDGQVLRVHLVPRGEKCAVRRLTILTIQRDMVEEFQ